MFQMPRHLFQRQNDPAQQAVAMPSGPGEPVSTDQDRHPAMRGLNVSPVHGRHCICDRCSPDSRAA
jgi:hypothetical protein